MSEEKKQTNTGPWIGVAIALVTATTSYLDARSGRQELMTRGMAAEREFITSTTELHQVTQGILDQCVLRDEVLKVRIDYLEKALDQQAETVAKVEKTAKKAKKAAKRAAPKRELVPAPDPPQPNRLQFRQHQPAYGK